MDFMTMVSQLVTHLTPLNVGLFVLIVAEEVVANLSMIKSNSVGEMVISIISNALTSLWKSKTNS